MHVYSEENVCLLLQCVWQRCDITPYKNRSMSLRKPNAKNHFFSLSLFIRLDEIKPLLPSTERNNIDCDLIYKSFFYTFDCLIEFQAKVSYAFKCSRYKYMRIVIVCLNARDVSFIFIFISSSSSSVHFRNVIAGLESKTKMN